jgi:acetylglutamate kinase
MEHVGMRPVVVHGGGPRISALMKERRKEPRFVRGLRVTDAETLEIVGDALEAVNDEIVDAVLSAGGRAIGLTLRDRLPLRAAKLVPEGGEEEDLGFVGRVTGVAMGSIVRECLVNRIPVVLPLARGGDGNLYNVNADAAAAAVAAALGAEKLVLMSDTHGVRLSEREDDYAASLTAAEARDLMAKGVIAGGMIPKVKACMTALAGGVRKTHIIDGRVRHSLLLEIYTDKGIGTEIVP